MQTDIRDKSKWLHILFRGNRDDFVELNSPDDDYTREFTSVNHLSLTIPLLEFKYINLLELYQLLAKQISDKSHKYGLILTSPRVVEALNQSLSQFSHLGTRERIVDAWKNSAPQYIYSVGEKTSQIAERVLGIKVNYGSSETGRGSELAKFIIKGVSPSEYDNLVLIQPHGDLTDGTLSQSLKSNGLEINSLVVYNNEPVPEIRNYLKKVLSEYLLSLDTKSTPVAPIGINLIFFSPSGVRALYPHLSFFVGELESFFESDLNILNSCIGPTTQKAMLDTGMKVFCTSSKPNAQTLIVEILNGISSA